MFSNLIESGSHTADLKRKGRFLLGTTAFYALLLAATGVGSIYAYNVRLDYNPDYEVLALMRFPPSDQLSEQPRREAARVASGAGRTSPIPTRTEVSVHTPYNGHRIASADTPEVGPKQAVRIGPYNSSHSDMGFAAGPYTPGVPGEPGGRGRDEGPAVADPTEPPPPPPPTPTPAPRQQEKIVPLSSVVISSKAVEKPAPPYPPIAKAAGVQGPVAVQIVVDEQGKVISARAVSGNPLLHTAAVQAAYRARFTPTLLGGRPMKVTGSITYNFLLR